MEKVTEATLHLEKVTEAMAKCNLSLEYLKVTEAMAKCNLSLNYSQKIFWSDWTIISKILHYRHMRRRPGYKAWMSIVFFQERLQSPKRVREFESLKIGRYIHRQ